MRQSFCRLRSKICVLASRLRLTSRFLSVPPGGEKRRFLCVSVCLFVPTKNHLSTVELCCLQHDVVVAFFIFSFFFFLGCYCDNICKRISHCVCACIQICLCEKKRNCLSVLRFACGNQSAKICECTPRSVGAHNVNVNTDR